MWVGSGRSTLCASANEELGTSADNNPRTLLVAPTSKVVGLRLQSERIEEQIGNIRVSPSVEDAVEVLLSLPQERPQQLVAEERR